MSNGYHQAVFEQLAVEYLITHKDGVYVDCTLGGGGHSLVILKNISPKAYLIGIDADPDALACATQNLRMFPNKILRQSFYDQLELVVYEAAKAPVDGVIYDLGMSSYQIDTVERGFSFKSNSPLDMRFNKQQKISAQHILNTYSRKEIERIIKEYGEERHWRAIAREIVAHRRVKTFQNSPELVEVVRSVIGERYLAKSLSRVFQALRIEVNQELTRLKASLENAYKVLKKGGRLVAISYHSLEDRIVKNFMKEKQKDCICPPELPACICDKVRELKIITSRPITPGNTEIQANPRARSAKMRVAEKIVPYQPQPN